jgi:hypothetical protein
MFHFHKYEITKVKKIQEKYCYIFDGRKLEGSDHIVNKYMIEETCKKCGKKDYKTITDEYHDVSKYELFLSHKK